MAWLIRVAAATLLLAVPLGVWAAPGDPDSKTDKPVLDMFRDSPNSIPLDPRDPAKDISAFSRTCPDASRRNPGPIDVQRLAGGLAYQGIPTFFHAPIAFCPEDLKAGKVDIAIMGASMDLSVGTRGTAWGPQAVRTGEVTLPWGSVMPLAHPTAGDIDFMQILKVVDYGDAPIDPLSVERSVLSVHKLVREIAETGALPVIIGGDHSLMYPDVVAVSDVHGKGNVAVVHFDAHFDGIPLMFGHYMSHGAPVRRLIDEGHVRGRNFVQIGLNSAKPGASDMEWMRKNEIRYHFMAEIDKKGWQAVMKEALAEARDGPKKIFISVDTDVLDPAWAPGMGTPEPGGMSIRELFPMLRALAVQNEIVGIELVELNPIVDQTYRSKLVAVRIIRELLTGIAMRRKGITDPDYIDPMWLDHGVKTK